MSRALRIVFLKNGMDPIDGSAEHLVNYAALLRCAKHRPSILISNPAPRENQYRRRLRELHVPVSYLGHLRNVVAERLRRAAWRVLGQDHSAGAHPSWWDLLETGLSVTLRRTRPDLVHVFVDPAAPLGIRAALAAGVPVLCHELISPRPSPATDSYYDELAALLPRCASVAAQSRRLAQECHEKIPFSGRIVVIPNMVEDPGEFLPDSSSSIREDVVLGFASRFEPRKAPLAVVEAFAQAVKRQPRLRLRMAGDGPQRAQAKERAAQLGVLEWCVFPGAYSDRRARDAFFREIDLLVQPSLAEGLPNAIIEAMAHQKAIITTDVGGIGDILTATSALFVPPDDVIHLASAMTRLAANAELRLRLGRAARDVYLRTFSPATVQPILFGEYRRILGASA